MSTKYWFFRLTAAVSITWACILLRPDSWQAFIAASLLGIGINILIDLEDL